MRPLHHSLDVLQQSMLTPGGIEVFIACRLIALHDKCTGIRPIGIGQIIRWIVGKDIAIVARPDIMDAVGVTCCEAVLIRLKVEVKTQ